MHIGIVGLLQEKLGMANPIIAMEATIIFKDLYIIQSILQAML
jgi:hypothetical protein